MSAAELIAQFEGFRAQAYYDYGQYSVGYGSTATSPTQVVTQAEAVQMLNEQIVPFRNNVEYWNQQGGYNWSQDQKDALTSFAYNIGSINELTDNGRRSNEEIAEAMSLYVNAGGQPSDGLINRRAQERALFTGQNPEDFGYNPNATFGSVDENGFINAPTPATTEDDYDGLQGLEAIRSLEDLENGSHMLPNSLDVFDNYTYHLELFLVDSKDTRDFLTNPTIGQETANGNWPNSGVKKITVASTGETSEIMISDLNVESVSYGSSTASISNSALNLNFTLTRVGHGYIADVLQDAALIAGYHNISIANFFVKIDFYGYDKNGNEIPMQGATKVIPFRLSKLTDIDTQTDQRGTTAVIEGIVTRKSAVINSSASMLNYPLSIPINQENTEEVLTTFITKLNEKILQKHPTNNSQYLNTYKIELSQDFKDRFPELKIGSDVNFTVGTAGGTRRTEPNPATNTTGSAQPTLELSVGTSIFDIIKDILINTEAINGHLTTAERGFSDVFSIEVDYLPKENGYNLLLNTEGAEITYTIGLKELLIQQNGVNDIEHLTYASEVIQHIISRNRLSKKYYYYYTGKNDQIIDLKVSLNQQLTKTYNDSSTAFFDIREIQMVEDYVGNLQVEENQILTDNRREEDNIQRTRAALTNEMANIDVRLNSQLDRATSIFEDTVANSDLFVDDGFRSRITVPEELRNDPVGFVEYINLYLQNNGLSESEELTGLFSDITRNSERLQSLISQIRETEDGIERLDADFYQGVTNIVSEQIMDRLRTLDVFGNVADLRDTDTTFRMLTESDIIDTDSPFAIEDLSSDIRTTLTPAELLPFINLSISNGVRFRSLVLEEMSNPSEMRSAYNDSRRGIELARRKFIEAYQQDISMQEATMTIKGDPFWLENYKVDARAQMGSNNADPTQPNDSCSIAGPHTLMIITNTTDGTDSYHNPLVTNLFRYIYVVKRVHSSFSNGLFTQTLDMNKFPLAQAIDALFTSPATPQLEGAGSENDGSGGADGVEDNGSPSAGVPNGTSEGVDPDNQAGGGSTDTETPTDETTTSEPVSENNPSIDDTTEPYVTPTYPLYSSSGDPFTPTPESIADYEEAIAKYDSLQLDNPENETALVTVVFDNNGVQEVYQERIVVRFADPELAAQYGLVAVDPNVIYDANDPMVNQWSVGNLNTLSATIASEYSTLAYGEPNSAVGENGTVITGPLQTEISIGGIVILNPEEQ